VAWGRGRVYIQSNCKVFLSGHRASASIGHHKTVVDTGNREGAGEGGGGGDVIHGHLYPVDWKHWSNFCFSQDTMFKTSTQAYGFIQHYWAYIRGV